MKRILVFTLLLFVAFVARADGYGYLILAQSGGERTAVEASGLVITFADGYLVATGADGKTTRLPLEGMSSMWFSETSSTAIKAVESDYCAVEAMDGSLMARAKSGTRYVVATPSGMVVSRGVLTGNGNQIIASGLTRGLYVVKIGQKNIKTQVR